MAATSLHEAFKLVEDDEDTSILRGVLMGYILDPHKEILMTMNKNLGIIIQKYGNKHTVQNFKGRTPHIETE
jgi:hypothetical protein